MEGIAEATIEAVIIMAGTGIEALSARPPDRRIV